MADTTFAYTPGSGAAASIDRISGTDYPHYKIKWGPPGTVNDADVASGKPLPIQLRRADGTAASFGAGATDAGTQRVTIASEQVEGGEYEAVPSTASTTTMLGTTGAV